ncbi:MAG: hypothetical protein WKF57_06585 [Nakamurella sp.]
MPNDIALALSAVSVARSGSRLLLSRCSDADGELFRNNELVQEEWPIFPAEGAPLNGDVVIDVDDSGRIVSIWRVTDDPAAAPRYTYLATGVVTLEAAQTKAGVWSWPIITERAATGMLQAIDDLDENVRG